MLCAATDEKTPKLSAARTAFRLNSGLAFMLCAASACGAYYMGKALVDSNTPGKDIFPALFGFGGALLVFASGCLVFTISNKRFMEAQQDTSLSMLENPNSNPNSDSDSDSDPDRKRDAGDSHGNSFG